MKYNLNTIKNLRQITGRGLMDCRKALENSNTFGDAIEFLNKLGYILTSYKTPKSKFNGNDF